MAIKEKLSSKAVLKVNTGKTDEQDNPIFVTKTLSYINKDASDEGIFNISAALNGVFAENKQVAKINVNEKNLIAQS